MSSLVSRNIPRRTTLVRAALVVLIPILAGWALHGLNENSEDRLRAAAHLERLGNDVNGAAADMGWSIATHAPRQAVEPRLRAGQTRVAADIASLTADEASGIRVADVARDASAFMLTVDGALPLLDAGGINPTDPAQTLAAKNAELQHDALIALINGRMIAVTAEADRAEWLNEAGTWLVLLLMSATLAAGLWRLERKRRRSAIARAHRIALEESERSFRLLFERNPVPMWTYDPRTRRFLGVNDAAVDTYGYSRDEFLGMTVLDIRPAEDRDAFLLSSIPPHSTGLLRTLSSRHLLKGGRVIDVDLSAEDLDVNGVPVRLVAARDVTDQRRLEAELRQRAFHDSLTGLANRALFHDRLGQAVARRQRHDQPVGVMVLDIDNFKAINDTHGHLGGDRVLTEVATRLTATLRPADTVARTGGDEFAVIVEGMAGTEALEVARRASDALRRPIAIDDGAEVWISACVGVAVGSGQGLSGEELVRQADIAGYEAKAAGRGLIEIFEPRMRSSALYRIERAADLRRALADGELFLEYQPVVRLADGGIRGVEALVRWRRPDGVVVSPADFIPTAEESGLIVPIGEWVLEEGCRQVREWEARLPAGRRLALSVNVSPRQLREAAAFVDTVAGVLEKTGFVASQLVLEVTESTLVDDVAQARERLEELRTRGVRIALDDFGTGYSSLGYLHSLPLDTIKIDRMFVSGIDGDGQARELALAIVRLIDTLGLPTVAEGMETVEELAYVRALGVDFAQGYILSRPLDAAAMADLLAGEDFDLEVLTRPAPTVVGAEDLEDGEPVRRTSFLPRRPSTTRPAIIRLA